MAYISPNTTVKFLRGCPVDRSYNHSIRFGTNSAQYSYFNGLVKPNQTDMATGVTYSFTINNHTYQRSTNDSIKVQIPKDLLIDCNYMMFKNSAFSNKWFYAFIDNEEYINNVTTEVFYTIDDIQTWWFDFTLADCFVEREHSETDNLFENLVEENIGTNERVTIRRNDFNYIPQTLAENLQFFEYDVCIFYSNDGDYILDWRNEGGASVPNNEIYAKNIPSGTFDYMGSMIGDAYFTGLRLFSFYENDVPGTPSVKTERIRNIICSAIFYADQHPGDIGLTAIYIVPHKFFQRANDIKNQTYSQLYYDVVMPTDFNYSYKSNLTYTPKNKKCYNFPFTSLQISNTKGQSLDFKWEYFKNENSATHTAYAKFKTREYLFPELLSYCYPINYMIEENNNELSVTFNDFLSCVWTSDSYTQWLSQNGTSILTSTLGSILTGGARSSYLNASKPQPTIKTVNQKVGNPLKYAQMGKSQPSYSSQVEIQPDLSKYNAMQTMNGVNTFSAILDTVATVADKQALPDTLNGQANGSFFNYQQNFYGYIFRSKAVPAEIIEIVDQYFDKYGYAIQKVKVPNIKDNSASLRPHWNFIKTRECLVEPATGKGLPSEVEEKIQNIFNSGITFWEDGDEIGDYSLDNSPS